MTRLLDVLLFLGFLALAGAWGMGRVIVGAWIS